MVLWADAVDRCLVFSLLKITMEILTYSVIVLSNLFLQLTHIKQLNEPICKDFLTALLLFLLLLSHFQCIDSV